MDDNGRSYRIHGLRCVMCDEGPVIQLANKSRVTLKCAACGYVFSVVRLIADGDGQRTWLESVAGLPPFLLAVV